MSLCDSEKYSCKIVSESVKRKRLAPFLAAPALPTMGNARVRGSSRPTAPNGVSLGRLGAAVSVGGTVGDNIVGWCLLLLFSVSEVPAVTGGGSLVRISQTSVLTDFGPNHSLL